MAMTLRLTPEEEANLTALAKARNISKQQAAVLAINETVARDLHKTEVSAAIEFAVTRYADVLERLGK